MRLLVGILVLLALSALSCGKADDSRSKSLTERQRDSILSKQDLPGAGVVGRALEVSDSAAARAARIDSLP
jgi:hypothetical protein